MSKTRLDGRRVEVDHVVGDVRVLAALTPESVVVTDSLPRDADAPFPLRMRSIAPLLAGAIERLAADRPLGDLAAHG